MTHLAGSNRKLSLDLCQRLSCGVDTQSATTTATTRAHVQSPSSPATHLLHARTQLVLHGTTVAKVCVQDQEQGCG